MSDLSEKAGSYNFNDIGKDKNKNIKNIILVSSYYHLPRSLIIFEHFLPNVSTKVLAAEEKLEINKALFFHLKLIMFRTT